MFGRKAPPPAPPSPLHPYFPVEAKLVDYVPNDWSVLHILAIFGGAIVLVMGVVAGGVRFFAPQLGRRDRLLTLWFAVSGLIHLIIEGYFSINHARMASRTDYLGQGWKEYSRSDSRYLTVDSFLVCMESVTAFAWGPLCLYTIWLIMTVSPWRHPVQAFVSTGQLYGNVLYYSTNLFEFWTTGISYSQPDLIVYIGYFIGMNLFWIVIPAYCIITSAKETRKAFIMANVRDVPSKAKK